MYSVDSARFALFGAQIHYEYVLLSICLKIKSAISIKILVVEVAPVAKVNSAWSELWKRIENKNC